MLIPLHLRATSVIRALMTVKAAWMFLCMFWDTLSLRGRHHLRADVSLHHGRVSVLKITDLHIVVCPWGRTTLFIHTWLGVLNTSLQPSCVVLPCEMNWFWWKTEALYASAHCLRWKGKTFSRWTGKVSGIGAPLLQLPNPKQHLEARTHRSAFFSLCRHIDMLIHICLCCFFYLCKCVLLPSLSNFQGKILETIQRSFCCSFFRSSLHWKSELWRNFLQGGTVRALNCVQDCRWLAR